MTVFKVFTAFALILCAEATAQTSFWTNSSVPTLREDSDNKSVTVGLNFYSDVPGSITGVRFYKGSGTLARTSEPCGPAPAPNSRA